MSSTIEHAVRRRTQHPLSFMPSYPFPWWPWQWRAFCQNVAFITFSNRTISNKNKANKGLIWVQQEMPYCCAFIYHIFWYNVHSYMYNSPAPAGFPHQDLGSEINLLRDWPTVGDFLITRTCCPERMGWQQQPKQRGIRRWSSGHSARRGVNFCWTRVTGISTKTHNENPSKWSVVKGGTLNDLDELVFPEKQPENCVKI